MKTWFATLLATAALPALAGQPEGLHFTHNDWEVACDNTRTCRAAGYQSEDSEQPAVSILLERKGGPRQPIVATLQTGTYDEKDPAPARDLTMQIGSRSLGTVATDPKSGMARLSPAQTAAFVAALAKDSVLRWTDGKHTWTVSGKGAAAVLLKMDEWQGRIGSVDAAMRKGGKPADAALPALAPPVITPASAGSTDETLTPAARTTLLREVRGILGKEDCTDLAADGLTAVRLTPEKLLVSGTCWTGAYNEGVGYFVTNRQAPYSPVLVTLDGSDYAAGTISSMQKGRGLGDCWAKQEWVWDGRRFMATLTETTGMCRLVAAGGAWTLPTYVAEVRRGRR